MTTAHATVRVLVVDDHPVVHLGLRSIFTEEPWLDVIGEAFTPEAALAEIERSHPDLVIIDLSLGQVQSSGLQLVRDVRDRWPEIRVLVLTMHDETLYAGRAMRAGAHGYVTKRDAVRDLVDAIRIVMGGETYLKSGMRTTDEGSVRRADQEAPRIAVRSLSDRELEVYEMIGQGLGTREIAETLSVSVKTVETHRTRIKSKLGIASTQQLVRSAVQWATLDSDAASL
jgi:DNA-binding NarL/FixJ family response regulator